MENILYSSSYLSLDDIKKVSECNWRLCFDMLQFHVNENIPYMRDMVNSVKDLQTLFTNFPKLYFIFFDQDIIKRHIDMNNMIDDDHKINVLKYLANIYDAKFKIFFDNYWDQYFTKSFKTMKMMQNTEILKLHRILLKNKITIGDLEFSAVCGSIMVIFQKTTILKIDITTWTYCEISSSKVDEAKFYINHPKLLIIS